MGLARPFVNVPGGEVCDEQSNVPSMLPLIGVAVMGLGVATAAGQDDAPATRTAFCRCPGTLVMNRTSSHAVSQPTRNPNGSRRSTPTQRVVQRPIGDSCAACRAASASAASR